MRVEVILPQVKVLEQRRRPSETRHHRREIDALLGWQPRWRRPALTRGHGWRRRRSQSQR